MGQRLGYRHRGRVVAVLRRAYNSWCPDHWLDPTVPGRNRNLLVLCYVDRDFPWHRCPLDAAARLAVHAGVPTDEHAVRQQYAAGKHAALARDIHGGVALDTFRLVRPIDPLSWRRDRCGLGRIPCHRLDWEPVLRPRALAVPIGHCTGNVDLYGAPSTAEAVIAR